MSDPGLKARVPGHPPNDRSIEIWHDFAVRETTGWPQHDDHTERVLLVGEDNPQSSAINHTLYPSPPGCAGNRLPEVVLQLPEDVYLSHWRANLCTGVWDRRKAGLRVLPILSPTAPWKTVFLLGRKVAKAFAELSGGELPVFETRTVCPGVRLCSLPHPSGRCRKWNDPSDASAARGCVSGDLEGKILMEVQVLVQNPSEMGVIKLIMEALADLDAGSLSDPTLRHARECLIHARDQLICLKAGPIPMRIHCPDCRELHVDEGVFATKPHHTHSCQACGLTWRPAVVHTVGVRFLPGFGGPK